MLADRENPTDNCDSLATSLGDFWVTLLGGTVQNRAKWMGTDGFNP